VRRAGVSDGAARGRDLIAEEFAQRITEAASAIWTSPPWGRRSRWRVGGAPP